MWLQAKGDQDAVAVTVNHYVGGSRWPVCLPKYAVHVQQSLHPPSFV